MSLQAYQSVARRAEDPRQTEYRLFADVTRSLIEAAATPVGDIQTRISALDWNRRLWTTLASDCWRADNGLPAPLRARIISLSIFVQKHSSEVMQAGESFDPLIEINRSVMQGLAGAPVAA